jgi:hypothetical protein
MSALGDKIRVQAAIAAGMSTSLTGLAAEADGVITPPPVDPPPVDPPPPVGSLPCSGFAGTEIIDVAWALTPHRYVTTGFKAGVAVVARFTVPAGAHPSTSLGSISFTEYGDTSHTRWATFSDRPCAWTDPGGGAFWYGVEQISARFWLQVGQTKPGYPVLVPGRTYYLSIRNTTQNGTPTTNPGESCNIGLDWSKPPGS